MIVEGNKLKVKYVAAMKKMKPFQKYLPLGIMTFPTGIKKFPSDKLIAKRIANKKTSDANKKLLKAL